MSISNLLKINNYTINAQAIKLTGRTSSPTPLDDYSVGQFEFLYTTSGDSNTGVIPASYVKVGRMVTLVIKNSNFVITNPGYVILSGMPALLNPEQAQNGGFDIVNFPMYYLQATGNYTRKLDMDFSIQGPVYASPLPNAAYITPADIFASGPPDGAVFAPGSYVLQQTSYSYIAAN